MRWRKTEFSDIQDICDFLSKTWFLTFVIFALTIVFFLPNIVLKPDFEYGHWFLYSRLFILDGDFKLADTYHN